jgi:hypothetical protein
MVEDVRTIYYLHISDHIQALLPHPVAVNILDLDVELYDDCQFRLDTVDWLKIVVCFLAPEFFAGAKLDELDVINLPDGYSYHCKNRKKNAKRSQVV